MNLNLLEVKEIVRRALMEDVGSGDITTALTIPWASVSRAEIITRENGVIAGLPVAAMVFEMAAKLYVGSNSSIVRKLQAGRMESEPPFKPSEAIRITAKHLGPGVQVSGTAAQRTPSMGKARDMIFSLQVAEGSAIERGDSIAHIVGPTDAILTGERVALNFLQRMSGIATRTARLINMVSHTAARIVDTRKTVPGLRILDKYAVRMGGGHNHRFGLYDAVLIKDNHIQAAGGIKEAVGLAKAGAPHTVKIEVECDTIAQVEQALEVGADMVLLDNMSVSVLKRAVGLCKGRALTEASGRVTEENIVKIAEAGVDLISVGALTHSVKALDLTLEILG
jgi:nicotinate-nucleotide pyrophosphorylase (carboxylating)